MIKNLGWGQILQTWICKERKVNILKVNDEKIHLAKYESRLEQFVQKQKPLLYSLYESSVGSNFTIAICLY